MDLCAMKGMDLCAMKGVDLCAMKGVDLCAMKGMDLCAMKGMDLCAVKGMDLCAMKGMDLCAMKGMDLCAMKDCGLMCCEGCGPMCYEGYGPMCYEGCGPMYYEWYGPMYWTMKGMDLFAYLSEYYLPAGGWHMQTTGLPTIKLLTCFPSLVDGISKIVNIIQKTSTSYSQLGMHLLDDDNCEIIDVLKEKCHHDPVEIITAVYKKWISGTGKKPTTWQTLIGVLREIELNSLADEIEHTLCSTFSLVFALLDIKTSLAILH